MTRKDGICLLSSTTTKCHACYYPTGENEQVFQIYFATPEKPETWKPLSAQEGTLECEQLAQILEYFLFLLYCANLKKRWLG